MYIEDLKYIADVEMMREGCLSKGVRLEIAHAARRGVQFQLEISADDAERLGSLFRNTGHTGIMATKKATTPNRKIVTFNSTK